MNVERSRTRRAWILAGVVAAAAAAPYWSALGNEFITWDDNIIILGQPFLRTLTLDNLWQVLSPVPAREEWLPLRDLTLLLNFAACGENAFAFVTVNIALHAAAAAAVFFLLLRLAGSWEAALAGGLVFALHAVHVESVTWLSGRKDPLSAIFIVTALIAHIRWRHGDGRYATVLVLLGLALLSKASAFVFPAYAAAYDLCYLRSLTWRKRIVPIVPYAVIAFAGIFTFLKLISADGVIEDYPAGGLAAVLLTNVVLLRDYLVHLVLPLTHQAIYEVSFLTSIGSGRFLAAVAAHVLVAAAAWRWRRTRWAPFAALFFYASFVPYLNIVPHGIYYAERYLYLPSIAFSLVVGVGVAAAFRALSSAPRWRWAATTGICVFLAAHAVLLSSRNPVWASSERFWSYQAAVLPRNPAPLMNLAETREAAGADEAAARTYESVLADFGEVPEAVFRLGRIAARHGDIEIARRLYLRHAELCPSDPRSQNNLAQTYLATGQPEKAVEILEPVIAAHPRYVLARANLAVALERCGRPEAARERWREVLATADLLPQEPLVREARRRLGSER